ncbi:MAG: Hpt domain-containing protein [Sulfurimonas sp.]|nr:Hpt domain-containing protein [Sulfurimonas sp.]MDQ7059813.1 Hpt domain-containing protein [Sulfurimonas sp.]
MLVFNHKKEFVGIDKNDLEALGFSNLSQLQAEADEFADMFVKKPGFIHNFKHVNWIDFVECADSPQGAKVIINANAKNFQCFMSVQTIYLTDEPFSKAFIIHLNNINELTDNETEYVAVNLLEQSIPEPILPPMEPAPVKAEPIIKTIEPVLPLDLDFTNEKEELQNDVKLEDDFKIDLEVSQDAEALTVYDNTYIFDPLIASNELGLPVDLIEEFIEDFIAQAKEFKDDLYNALNDGDIDNLKALSHKLKGVAANLRIEDALESLTIINTSSNNDELKTELDTFYKIVSKFSNEPTESTQAVEVTPAIREEELDIFASPQETDIDDFELSFKDEERLEHINIPELADDDFKTPIVTYSKENIANEIGLDQETFNELFEEYLLEAKELSNSIETAIQTENTATWKHLSIKLKSMSDNMRVVDLTKDLETLINTQEASVAKIANEQVIACINLLSTNKE